MPTPFAIPPFAHPLPERKLGLVATADGLYIIPRTHHLHPASTDKQQQQQHHHPQHGHAHSSSTPSSPPTSNARRFAPFSAAAKRLTNGSLGPGLAASPSSPAAVHAPPLPPSLPQQSSSTPSLPDAVRVGWGKDGALQRIPHAQWTATLHNLRTSNHGEAVQELTIHGLVGLERLFNRAYLFVITARKDAGQLGHATRKIYCCSGVLAIPLEQDKATEVIAMQMHKDKAARKGETQTQDSQSEDKTIDEEDNDTDGEDDVETPAAIPREPFFAQAQLGSGAATARAPKSKAWSTRESVRTFSQGRLGDGSAAEQETGKDEIEDVDLPTADGTAEAKGVEDVTTTTTSEGTEAATATPTPDEAWRHATRLELEEKVVKETSKHFARGEFWFAYDFDLTTSMQKKHDTLASCKPIPSKATSTTTTTKTTQPESGSGDAPAPSFEEPLSNLPLWRRADRRFWHNEHLSRDLISAGLDAFILPLMQGYLQIVSLPLSNTDPHDDDDDDKDETTATLIVISRRSKERAGLRYQRRGINEQGQVANFVETEQILLLDHPSSSSSSSSAISRRRQLFSFVQIRGSIPLFWSQSPFSLKPPPVLERSEVENEQACARHFQIQTKMYGRLVCINLAEQTGKEGVISKRYKETVQKLDLFRVGEGQEKEKEGGGGEEEGKGEGEGEGEGDGDGGMVEYRDFDFHKECAGMKFENSYPNKQELLELPV